MKLPFSGQFQNKKCHQIIAEIFQQQQQLTKNDSNPFNNPTLNCIAPYNSICLFGVGCSSRCASKARNFLLYIVVCLYVYAQQSVRQLPSLYSRTHAHVYIDMEKALLPAPQTTTRRQKLSQFSLSSFACLLSLSFSRSVSCIELRTWWNFSCRCGSI